MNKVYFGDCRESMRRLIADGVKVQMCVTSPPYYGLRDYGHDGQLGLEETPEQYIANMVEVFGLVRELLSDDGTLWLNIGDSYAANRTYQVSDSKAGDVGNSKSSKVPFGLKPKDLIGIPWMLAFALRADGWYLRQDIIWSKPNPMPESVTDRCTKSHEYIFLLSKSKKYYFDHDAIKEPVAATTVARLNQDVENQTGSTRVPGKTNGNMKAVGGARSNRDNFRRTDSKRGVEGICPAAPVPTHREDRVDSEYDLQTRNKRSVWSICTKPYKGAHFATFPPVLVEPPILAGSRIGAIVFDPFMGSGSTAEVAILLGRKYLGCELNKEYEPLQQKRILSATTKAFDSLL